MESYGHDRQRQPRRVPDAGALDWHGPVPPPLGSFIGRADELDQLGELLSTSSVVTLCGPIGVGKTRLAVELAWRAGPSKFADGIWTASLADVNDDVDLLAVLAESLGVRDQSEASQIEAIRYSMAHRQLLFLIDGADRFIRELANALSAILPGSPASVLVTSRVVMGTPWERRHIVAPLELRSEGLGAGSSEHPEAVRLFAERATSACSTFEVTAHNAPIVTDICVRLGGLPLAIEFAAAGLTTFTLAETADLVARDPDPLASSAAPSGVERLPGVVTLGLERLEGPIIEFFGCLCLYRGSFDLVAAKAVWPGAPVEGAVTALKELVNSSLVTRLPDRGGDSNFAILSTLRPYGEAQLGVSNRVKAGAAYAEHVLSRSMELACLLHSPDQAHAIDSLGALMPDLRAVMTWQLDHDRADTLMAPLIALRWFWVRRGLAVEGAQWLVWALDRVRQHASAEYVSALATAAYLAWLPGDLAQADQLLSRATTLLGEVDDPTARATVAASASRLALDQDRIDLALAADQTALAAYQAAGDQWGEAWTRSHLAAVLAHGGRLDEARDELDETQKLFDLLGDVWGLATVLDLRTGILEMADDLAAAETTGRTAVGLYRSLDDDAGLPLALHHLGRVLSRQRRHEEAITLLEESMSRDRRAGNQANAQATEQLISEIAAVRNG